MRDESGDRTGFRAAATGRGCSPSRPTATASTTTSRSSRRAWRRRTGCSPSEGTLYFHIDYREAHYCKLLLDEIFGRECFLNEIIWAYDYGARSKRRWPAKHDTILVYVKDPGGLLLRLRGGRPRALHGARPVTPEKAARGKLPTDVWWHTIVPTNGREKTGYPTQKPEGILRRMVQASTRPGDWCLDFFAGSGTLGAVAAKLGRRYVLIDSNPEAVEIMRARLGPLPHSWLTPANLWRMYHLELRQFPHNTCRFNLTEQELRAVLEPWVREKFVEVGERKWSPHQAKLTILEGPRLDVAQLSMGRGWRAAQRQSEDVTERLLVQAKQADDAAGAGGVSAPGSPAPFAEQLLHQLGADPATLLQAWRLVAERRPSYLPASRLRWPKQRLPR